MKTDKCVIKKIVLDLDGVEVALTTKQAKKLKEALDELFGKEIVKEIQHYQYPVYWQHNSKPYDNENIVWCSNSGIDMQYMSDTGTLKLTG